MKTRVTHTSNSNWLSPTVHTQLQLTTQTLMLA